MSNKSKYALAPASSAPIDVPRSIYGDFTPDDQPEVFRNVAEEIQAWIEEHDEVPHYIDGLEKTGQLPPGSGSILRSVIESRSIGGNDIDIILAILYRTDNLSLLSKYRLNHPSYRLFHDHYRNSSSPAGIVPSHTVGTNERAWFFNNERIGFPIGIGPSSLTTNASWVQRWFQAGFNVVTYKTVRSRAVQPFTTPNWSFAWGVDLGLQVDAGRRVIIEDTHLPSASETAFSSVNSFGVPSLEPDDWAEDLCTAADIATDGQILIASVLGDTYQGESTTEALIEDFIRVSTKVVDCGVRHVELNLSCPNTMSTDLQIVPPLCSDIELASRITKRVRESLPADVSLGVKLSYMDRETVFQFLDESAQHIDFVSGINTVQATILTRRYDGQIGELFPGRSRAGVGGSAIRQLALEFIRAVAEFRAVNRAHIAIIGLGGVTDPASFHEMYRAGADVVQTVSGALANSLLAVDCKRELHDTLEAAPPTSEPRVLNALKERIISVGSDGRHRETWEYATELQVNIDNVTLALSLLLQDGGMAQDERGQSYCQLSSTG